jgi:hypothetical protein
LFLFFFSSSNISSQFVQLFHFFTIKRSSYRSNE